MSETTAIAGHQSLTNQFLIAMPHLQDPIFFHAVIYICEHSVEQGAVGIMVNAPLSIKFQDVLQQMKLASGSKRVNNLPVMLGGPIEQERGFILHTPGSTWRSTLDISDDVSITTSNDILQAIASEQGPTDTLIALGYAGWGPNQLESELVGNVWLNCPVNTEVLFKMPFEMRWDGIQKIIGIDLNKMSGQVGHA